MYAQMEESGGKRGDRKGFIEASPMYRRFLQGGGKNA